MHPTLLRFSLMAAFVLSSAVLVNPPSAWAQEGVPGGFAGSMQGGSPASRKPFTFRDAAETDGKQGAGLVTASGVTAAGKRAIAAKRIEEGTTMMLTDVAWKRPIHPRVLSDTDIKDILDKTQAKISLDPSKMWKIPGASAVIEIEHDAPQVSRTIGRNNLLKLDQQGTSAETSAIGVESADGEPPLAGTESKRPRGRNPSRGRHAAQTAPSPVSQPDPGVRAAPLFRTENAGARLSDFKDALFGTGNGASDDPNPQFRPKQIVASEHGADTLKVLKDELEQLKKSGVVVRAVNIRTPWKNFAIRSLGGLGNLFIAGAAGAGVSRIVNAGSIYFGNDKVELDQPYISEKEEKPGLVENFLSSAPKKAYDFQHSATGAALK